MPNPTEPTRPETVPNDEERRDVDSGADTGADRGDRRPDQVGIIPGKIPDRPTNPDDPRFPMSQPDIA